MFAFITIVTIYLISVLFGRISHENTNTQKNFQKMGIETSEPQCNYDECECDECNNLPIQRSYSI